MQHEVTASIAGAAGVSLVTGTILGLPAPALFAGFCGGVTMLALLPPVGGLWARICSVAASASAAGFLAPYLAARFHEPAVDARIELLAVGFATGFGAQVLLPAAVRAFRRRIDQAGGAAGSVEGDTK